MDLLKMNLFTTLPLKTFSVLCLVSLTVGCATNPATNAEAGQTAGESASQDSARATGDIYFDTEIMRWRAPDGGICHTCTAETGFPDPVAQGGFYFDPEVAKWRDGRDGRICNTCTPTNGFTTP